MRLYVQHPALMTLDCETCSLWQYEVPSAEPVCDLGTGEVYRREGKPPCAICPKTSHLPQDRCKENAVKLLDRHWQAWQHYHECCGVRHFPWQDPIVRMHAALFLEVDKALEHSQNDVSEILMAALNVRRV